MRKLCAVLLSSMFLVACVEEEVANASSYCIDNPSACLNK